MPRHVHKCPEHNQSLTANSFAQFFHRSHHIAAVHGRLGVRVSGRVSVSVNVRVVRVSVRVSLMSTLGLGLGFVLGLVLGFFRSWSSGRARCVLVLFVLRRCLYVSVFVGL